MPHNTSKCRLCGGQNLEKVFSLANQALTGVFPRSRQEQITSGPLDLVRCAKPGGCGLVQLLQSYDTAEMYGLNYGYRSGLNPSMVRHLRAKVQAILDMDILRDGDVVVDIGSNDATTLRCYPEGRYSLVGIDPTGVKLADCYPPSIRLIPDFFSAQVVAAALAGAKARVITSFSMFYDLEEPLEFAREIAASLHDEGVWVCEQSYLPAMLRTNSFDTICHEHLEFYALEQIAWLMPRAGLKLLDVEFNGVNGGSFSFVAARASSAMPVQAARIEAALQGERVMNLSGPAVFVQFGQRVASAREGLMKFLEQARSDGKRVCGLGASTKGNVLLQHFGIDERLVSEIGEVNSDKFGAYTPGSRIPMVPEDQMLASRPDYLLVLPWHFRDFFVANPKFKGHTLVFPLPALEIVRP